ncbi:MAG: bifunctional (p)ppGpp synthetase/guanosine-3',5'-bis(diphosphate) 3'-pyrophosphohydrolase [Nitrospiraceae bacterium]|nr:bifunctional (p)ppGpp synthetase/guanosine-3',5'-bis(diphosphate) 3'-pyrophosphohydrolase [Nitrospiraceae bacterium]
MIFAAPKEISGIEELLRKVRSYNPGADLEFIRRAYFFSFEAHGEQKRQEGSPYISHPLAVASILTDMKMDTVSVAAGLLHDTLEDTHITREDIQKRFGYELAFLVDSVTKLGRIQFQSREEEQAENFRRMLLSMAEDIRVIMIKFADRLHNMLTLQHLPNNRRQKIAQETLEIYAPLANRLGIGWLRVELEDLSFKYLLPALYEDMVKKVASRQEEQEGYISQLIEMVKARLSEEGLGAQVKGRIKHYYGIYQKMQRQNVTFDQIYDVLGIRIITGTKSECYAILGLIHSLWKPIPGKFKDYIGVPKSNMYQSLHTTVIGPEGKRVEFQIRTEDMNRVAEEGIAAHWKYKDKGHINPKDDRYIAWLRSFVQEIQDTHQTPREFMDAVKAEVVPDTIYVFTPNGDIKELPIGATPVDFAYSIHTEVGHRCTGARINGRMVPLKYRLNNGDTVEIITQQSHVPSRDWLGFLVTQRARARVKQWIKTEERKESLELGARLLEAEMKKRGLRLPPMKSELMAETAQALGFQDAEDMLVAVGYGKLPVGHVINRFAPGQGPQEPPGPAQARTEKQYKAAEGITITGLSNILYHVSKCCYPIPGDNLVGFITRGKGVSIHRRSCPNLPTLSADEQRLISVQWKSDEGAMNYARIVVDTIDQPGVVANLSSAISSLNINIFHMEAVVASQTRKARISFVLEVKDRPQLNVLTQKLMQVQGVTSVRR